MATAMLTGVLTLAGGDAMAFERSDTQLRYWYGPNFREPGIHGDIAKHVVSLTHSDAYEWGENFVNIDVLKSDHLDPANNSSDGAVEVYGVYRHDLSLNKLTGGQSFAAGPLRDVAVVAGFDLNTKNTTFDSEKRLLVAGLGVAFDVPGFWKIALLWGKEFSHNGTVGKPVIYDSTARLETVWGLPFNLGIQSMEFEGFGVINGPKGKDGFYGKTKTEILAHPKLMADIGQYFDDPGHLKVGVGYEYWRNKFGNDHVTVAGAEANAYFVEVAYHF